MAKKSNASWGLSDPEYHAVEVLHDYGLDLHSREIFVSGESGSGEEGQEPGVEFIMAARLAKNLRALTLQNEQPILIHLKTCGGYWEEGMAMYDAIVACPCKVTVLSYTHARSMSSIILQAADWRVLMPNSYFLFHFGDALLQGEAQTVLSNAEWLKRYNEMMLDIYADAILRSKRPAFINLRRGQVREKLRTDMQQRGDVFLSPQEAVNWGLADSIFDGDWSALLT